MSDTPIRSRRIPVLLLIVAVALLAVGCFPPQPMPSVEVERRVRDLLELHTYEHIYRDIVYFGEERSFLFFKTMDRRLLFSVNFRVRAGMDLTEGLRVIPDEADPTRLYVRLPAPRVLLVDADEESIHQYFVREQGGPITWLEYSDQLEAAKDRIRREAIDRGILEQAEQNAVRVLENFFTLAGFSTVQFDVAEADEGLSG